MGTENHCFRHRWQDSGPCPECEKKGLNKQIDWKFCEKHKIKWNPEFLGCPSCAQETLVEKQFSQPESPDKKFVDTYNYNHRRKTLISYLRMKTDEGDWHACSDAANDLRVLEAGNK